MARRRRNHALRAAIGACATVIAFALPPTAQASFHLMRVKEVYPGTLAFPDSAFVELQMYASGQNFVSGKTIRTYNAVGTQIHSFSMGGDAASGQNQRTILIGDQFANGGTAGDFEDDALGTNVVPAGGAVCYEAIDCVSWGNFTGNASLPSSAGTPVAGAIPDGSSIVRTIARGCTTVLDPADDTNSSAADFTVTPTETPQDNGDTPTETACPQTTITKKPKASTTDRTPTFKFKSSINPATFECKLDSGAYKSCDSPFTTKRLSRGRHTFKVKAVAGGVEDPTPARASFKVTKPH